MSTPTYTIPGSPIEEMNHENSGVMHIKENPAPGSTKLFWAGLIAATLLGAALRLYNLPNRTIDIDELHTVRHSVNLAGPTRHWAAFGPTALWLELNGVSLDELGPVHEWRRKGVTESLLRVPSVVLGILTIPVFIFALRRPLGVPGALLAGLFLALSSWHISNSQFARFYTAAFLLYNLGLLFYLRATQTGKISSFYVSLLLLGLVFFTHPVTVVGFGVVGAHALLFRPKFLMSWKRLAPVLAVTALCALYLAYEIFGGSGGWEARLGQVQPPWKVVLRTFWTMELSFSTFALISILLLLKRFKSQTAFFGIAAVLPIVIGGLAASLLQVSSKYIVTSCIFPFMILAAWGCARIADVAQLSRPWVASVAAAAIVVASLGTKLLPYYAPGSNSNRPPFDQAVDFARERKGSGDMFIVVQPTRELPVGYLLQEPTLYLPMEKARTAALTNRPAWYFVHGTGNPFEGRRKIDGMAAPFFSDEEMKELNMELKAVFYIESMRPHHWVRVYYTSEQPH